MTAQILVMAKNPVPGRVKTRLCPPATYETAARIAAAALTDTLDAVAATPADRRVLVLAGATADHPAPPHPSTVDMVAQRGDGLAHRLANAFADTARPGTAALLVGMDTPQLEPALLTAAIHALADADAVLGPAVDGGWWTLGLRDVRHAEALRGVPMSTPDTGRLTARALLDRGLHVRTLPTLRDVDTAHDARLVAGASPDTRFAGAVRALLPVPVAS